jgi:hypothetical protein
VLATSLFRSQIDGEAHVEHLGLEGGTIETISNTAWLSITSDTKQGDEGVSALMPVNDMRMLIKVTQDRESNRIIATISYLRLEGATRDEGNHEPSYASLNIFTRGGRRPFG